MYEVTGGTWADRLAVEAEELKERLEKLRAFMKGEGWKELDVADQELMQEQEGLMTRYLAVLGKRLGRVSKAVMEQKE